MSLQLILLQLLPVSLYDEDWREENVFTLHIWHPWFMNYQERAIDLLQQFYDLMKEYHQVTVTDCIDDPENPYGDLYNHVHYEVEVWFMYHMVHMNRQIWLPKLDQ